MTEPAAPAPQDQPPAAADGMIVCDQLVRIYFGEGIEVQALQGLDLLIAEGELAALVVLAVQTVITYHRGSGRALRIAD